MAKKLFRIETEKIETCPQYWIKDTFPNLQHWEGNLSHSSLNGLFWESSIVTFTGNVGEWGNETFTDIRGLFCSCLNLTTINSDHICGDSAWQLFYRCTNLKNFNVGKIHLNWCHQLFYQCESLEQISCDDFSASGALLFEGCTSLKTVNLPNWNPSNCIYNFTGCNSLESINFDTSNLTIATGMFLSCESLKYVNLDFPNLMFAEGMFSGAGVQVFDKSIENLIEGCQMFDYSESLTSFSSSTPNLLDGDRMFNECNNLSNFNGNLSGLAGGIDMFLDTNLSLESISNICDTLPNANTMEYDTINYRGWYKNGYPSPHELQEDELVVTYDPNIDIGIIYPTYSHPWNRNDTELKFIPKPIVNMITICSNSLNSDEKVAATNKIIELCRDKGWIVIANPGLIDYTTLSASEDVFYPDWGFLSSCVKIESTPAFMEDWGEGRDSSLLLEYLTWNGLNFSFIEQGGDIYQEYANQYYEKYYEGIYQDFIMPYFIDCESLGYRIILPKNNKVWHHSLTIEEAYSAVGIWAGSQYDVVEGSSYIPDASSWNNDVQNSGVLDNVSAMKVENGFVLVEEE